MLEHKIVTELTKVNNFDATFRISANVAKSDAKKPVISICQLSYEEGNGLTITGRQPFSLYDRRVYDAITSLFAAGNRIVTTDMVCRVMLGKTSQEKPSAAQKAAVTKSIEKMRVTKAAISCRAEFEMRRVPKDKYEIQDENETEEQQIQDDFDAVFDENLLNLRGVQVKAGKHAVVKAYAFLSPPVLYTYSLLTKQLRSVELDRLDIKSRDNQGKYTTRSLKYTEQRVVLSTYLLHRIEGMKGENKLRRKTIALRDYRWDNETKQGIYSIIGRSDLSQPAPQDIDKKALEKRKNDARSIRSDIEDILNYWVHIKYIKSFKPIISTNTPGAIKGYSINP